MLALLVLAEVTTRPPMQTGTPATASVRIERAAAIAREDQWDKVPRRNRREIIRREPDGRITVVRVIEHE
jgi:hypothetical protein